MLQKIVEKTLFNTLVSKVARIWTKILSTTGVINNSSYDTDKQNSGKRLKMLIKRLIMIQRL